MKYFRMSYDEVVFRRSYINLILLNQAIPSMKPFDKDGKGDAGDDDNDGWHTESDDGDNGNEFFMQFM